VPENASLGSAPAPSISYLDSGRCRVVADLGQGIVPREQQTPEALRALQKAEIEKWWPIIKGAGITAQ
jgi:hypothetical protein